MFVHILVLGGALMTAGTGFAQTPAAAGARPVNWLFSVIR